MTLTPKISRRVMLFLAILISGGNLLIPRPLILVLILGFYFLFFRGAIRLRKSLLFVVFLILSLLVFGFAHPISQDNFAVIIRFANFLVALTLLNLYARYSFSVFKSDVFALLKYMPHQAILTVILAAVTPFLFIPIQGGNVDFFSAFGVFNYHVTVHTTFLVRPNGFFFEPGVFQFYLNLLLYLTLFELKNKKLAILSVIALLCTRSSTGLVIMMILLGIFFTKNYVFQGSMKQLIIRAVAATVVLSVSSVIVYENLLEKVTGTSQGSFLARQYDTLTGISVVQANPLIGIGFDYDAYYNASAKLGFRGSDYFGERTKNRDNTNGVIMALYNLGIPLGAIFIWGMFRQKVFAARFTVGAVVFISLLTEPIIFTPFFLIIIFSGLMLTTEKNAESTLQ